VLIACYGYDVLGRRIVKRVYSTASGGTVGYTRFVYQGNSVAFETDSAGSIGLRYTWGLGTDNLLAIRDAAGNHLYVVEDPLGSVRGLVKRGGTWLLSVRYDPYGLVTKVDSAVPGPGMAWRYRWTGREYDAETGWYFHRSRYYDPVAKRFVQEDPIGYGGGTNLYAYVAGDVLEATDPNGELQNFRQYEPDYSFHSDLLKAGATGPIILVGGVEVSGQLFAGLLNLPAGVLVPAALQGVVVSARSCGAQCTIYTYGDGTEETRSGGSRTWRNNNAGAMGYGVFARSHGAIGQQGGMAVFPDESTGWQAEVALLSTPFYQRQTLDAAIQNWCGGPAAGCNVGGYQQYVRGVTGYSGDTSLSSLGQGGIWLVADAIRSYETWTPGTVAWRIP